MNRALCGTPWKVTYDSRVEAVAEVKRLQKRGQKVSNLRPYHCACGMWHLTSLTKRHAKQIRRRTRAA